MAISNKKIYVDNGQLDSSPDEAMSTPSAATTSSSSAATSSTGKKYQPMIKFVNESKLPPPRHRTPVQRVMDASLRLPRRLKIYIMRPLMHNYLKLSWVTRTTLHLTISLSIVLYHFFTIPYRIGFLYNPFGHPDVNKEWTTELSVFMCLDIIADLIGVYEFWRFYQLRKDILSQLSQSVSFEMGRKMTRDANRLKSPKISHRPRKGSITARSSKATWTLATISSNNMKSAMGNTSKAEHFWKNIELILELVALIPVEIFPSILGYWNALHLVRFTKLCRLYRMRGYLTRISEIYSERPWVQQLSHTGISSLVRNIAIGAGSCHWFACGYMFIANCQCGNFLEWCDATEETSWVIRDRLNGATVVRKYGRALYWASRTMVLLGYDDVTPVSDAETIYAIIVQVIGAVFSTSLLATYLFIFRYRNSRYASFSTHVDNARKYMKSQNIPRDVRRKVMAYFSYSWNTHHSLDSEEVLRLLPKHLQTKVVYSLKASRIKQVCFLMKESVEFINLLALALVRRVYIPNDQIIEPKINAKMFFVIRGTVVLSKFDGSLSKECQTGDFFADCCLLSPEKYEEKAVAKTFCELYVLEKEKFDAAVTHFYRGKEAQARAQMAETLEKYATQLRKTKKLLGLRGGGAGGVGMGGTSTIGDGNAGSAGFGAIGRVIGLSWRFPGSTFRARWDLLRLCGLIFVAFEVPYYVVFISNNNAQENFEAEAELGLRYAITFLIEAFFMADLVLRSRFFAYLDPVVMINVEDPTMIFTVYKANGFYFDLLAVIPVGLILESTRDATMNYAWIWQLLRLIRLRHALDLIQDMGDYYNISSKVLLVSTLLLSVSLALHIVACLWFEMSWMDFTMTFSEAEESSTELTRKECLHDATHFQNCSWVLFDCYGHVGATFPKKNSSSIYTTAFTYLRSIYWAVVALTGVGYGDIVAFSTMESYFAALWIFLGGIINFGVVGAMSSILANLMATHHHHIEKLNTLNSVMEHLGISEKLRADIRRFYHHQFHGRKKAYESQLLSHLPDQLCYQISSLLHSEATKCVALFDSASREFLEEVTGKFRHRTYQNGETFYVEGNTCNEFLVILYGRVNLFFQSKKVPVGALHEGDCYGVNEFLLKRSHPATLTAVSPINASVMTRDQFDIIQRKFAEDVQDMKAGAYDQWIDSMARLKRIASNLERLKLKPHVLQTTSIFYQRESSYVMGGGGASNIAGRQRYRDIETTRTNITSIWNASMTVWNIYNSFSIIFRIAFHSHIHASHTIFTVLWVIDVIGDLVFAGDIYLRLFYFECQEVGLENLLQCKQVDRRYLRSLRFRRDLLASLPLYYMNHGHAFVSSLCRLPRLIRCFDLWTYIDDVIVQIQQKFASQNVSSYLSPLKLLFFLLLAAHYAACIFFWISEYECKYNSKCWVETDHLIHLYHHSLPSLYIRSFYWALTTLTLVGSREIVPRGSPGTIWAALTCLCCSFVMGYIVGELSELILALDKEAKEYKSRVDSFENFAKQHDLSETLRARVGLFFKVQYEYTQGKDIHETVHDLSANLLLQLMHEIYGASIFMLPISRFLTLSQVNNLALRLKSELFIPGDDVVMEDTLGSRLCILRKGLAAVFWTESVTNVGILMENCLFGEIAFFIPNQRRLATVKATTSCEVLHISKHAWQELWTNSSDNSDNQIQKHSLNSILDWVKNRIERYQENALVIAKKTKRLLIERKVAQNLQGMMSRPSKVKGIGIYSQSTKMNRRMSFIRPEEVILEKKAKYLLAKVDAFTKRHRQYVMQLQDEHGITSTKSAVMSANSKESDHRKPLHPISHHLQALTAQQKKKLPPKALDLVTRQFIIEMNPVNKHIRDHIDDEHLRLLEDECWKRFKYMGIILHTVEKMMEALIPSKSFSASSSASGVVRVAPFSSVVIQPNKSSATPQKSKKTPHFNIFMNAYTATDSGKLVRMHSFHVDNLQIKGRREVKRLNVDHKNSIHLKQLTRPPSGIISQSNLVANSKASRRFTECIDLSSMNLPIINAESSANAEAKDKATQMREGILSRMKRCQSLPLFEDAYFNHEKQVEMQKRKMTRGATNGIESTLRGTIGINFEILQRCKRPKFSALYRLYRKYYRWSTNAGQPLSSTGSTRSSASTRNLNSKVRPPSTQQLSSSADSRQSKQSKNSIAHRHSILWNRLQKQETSNGSDAHSREFMHLLQQLGKLWDLLMLLIALYSLIVAPLKVCFAHDLTTALQSSALSAWLNFDWFLDILCFIDIVFKIRHPVNLEASLLARGKVHHSHHQHQLQPISSLLNFLESLTFYPEFHYDAVALLPLELLIFGMNFTSMSYAHKWRVVCFLRVNKILYAQRIGAFTESLIQYLIYDLKVPVGEALLYFLRSLAAYLVMGHLIACIWFAAGDNALKIYHSSWLSTSGMLISDIEEIESETESTGHSSEETVNLAHVSMTRKYFRSMHFAIGSITTLFYGDIVSINLIELFVEIAVILWSIYIYGSLVGAHGELLEVHSRKRAIFEQTLSELQHYLVENDVPKALKKQIKQYYASIWRRRHGEEEFEVIANVSRTLQEDVVYATLKAFAWKVAVFHSLDMHFLRALLVKLHYVVCSEGEEVVMKGDVDRSMYFISQGRVLVKQEILEINKEKGEFFGELALLYGIPHMETCVALTISELYRLDHDPYEELLLDFPEYRIKNKLDWTATEAATPGVLLSVLSVFSMGATSSASQLPINKKPNGQHQSSKEELVEEEVPHTFVYRGTMRMLAQLGSVDSLEAKHIFTKGKTGARKYLKQLSGLHTSRSRARMAGTHRDPDNNDDSSSISGSESDNEVHNYDPRGDMSTNSTTNCIDSGDDKTVKESTPTVIEGIRQFKLQLTNSNSKVAGINPSTESKLAK